MDDCLPREMDAVTVLQFIKDAITSDYDEIVASSVNFESYNIWISYYNFWVSIKLWKFRLYVTKCTAYREPTREDTVRSQDYLTPHALRLLNLDDRCVLVYPSVITKDSFHLDVISRFMIIRKAKD